MVSKAVNCYGIWSLFSMIYIWTRRHLLINVDIPLAGRLSSGALYAFPGPPLGQLRVVKIDTIWKGGGAYRITMARQNHSRQCHYLASPEDNEQIRWWKSNLSCMALLRASITSKFELDICFKVILLQSYAISSFYVKQCDRTECDLNDTTITFSSLW